MVNGPAASAGRSARFAGSRVASREHGAVFIEFFLVSGVARRLLSIPSPRLRRSGDEWISRLTPFWTECRQRGPHTRAPSPNQTTRRVSTITSKAWPLRANRRRAPNPPKKRRRTTRRRHKTLRAPRRRKRRLSRASRLPRPSWCRSSRRRLRLPRRWSQPRTPPLLRAPPPQPQRQKRRNRKRQRRRLLARRKPAHQTTKRQMRQS